MYDRRPERAAMGIGAAGREGLMDGALRLGDMSSEKALLFPEVFSGAGDFLSLPMAAIACSEASLWVGLRNFLTVLCGEGRRGLPLQEKCLRCLGRFLRLGTMVRNQERRSFLLAVILLSASRFTRFHLTEVATNHKHPDLSALVFMRVSLPMTHGEINLIEQCS